MTIIFLKAEWPPLVVWIESIRMDVGTMTLNPLTTKSETFCGQIEIVPLNASIGVYKFNFPNDVMGNAIVVAMNTTAEYSHVIHEVHINSK